MTRTLAALTATAALLLTGACSAEDVSGDSNPSNQTDQLPAEPDADSPEQTQAP